MSGQTKPRQGCPGGQGLTSGDVFARGQLGSDGDSGGGRMARVVEVNWKGIARTAKALGGEGTNYLLLKTKQQVDEGTLDAALPAVEEGPDNGGWFLGPQGWMLLIEGPDEQVNPWIVQLADRLTAAGIEGTLTGAGVAAPPMWCRGDWDSRGLHANLALQPRADARALDVGLGWLTGHGGKVLVSTG